ncbi:MAG: trypsin-like peptidase domain-containing protein, partial [Acidimicrobiia bacterium]|nr:trypsin-like peptidase domain-containing protein [Acidimicrobiia bacterium]
MSATDPSNDSRKKWQSLLGSVAYFALVALVVVGVYLVSSDPKDEPPEATPPPTDSALRDRGEEPVADAAAVILPSVVNIQSESGIGSGVVFSNDGLIVTAAHIVEGAETVRVRFLDGAQTEGEVIGVAPQVDIAVIKVERTDLVPASFSVEKPRVGQLAVAVGSPFTLESTVTAGIISAVDRTNCTDRELCLSMLQTDAAINPGNSGGALVNR